MTSTPLIKLDNFYIKREDLNITGSAKDRAIQKQIDFLVKSKITNAVISSTGNAAISAAYFCQKHKISLTIFVSTNINRKKLKIINQLSQKIIQTKKPISGAFKFCKSHNAYNLRQSTDPLALIGYQEIGKDLIKDLPQITSLFVPVGSGTTLLGINQALPTNVKIFAVQPASNPYISSLFDKDYSIETSSLTDSLTVRYTPLKSLLVKLIKDRGGAYVINNHQIKKAQQYLKQKNIISSPESAMALAGLFKAQNKTNIGEYPVVIFTGAKR